MPPVVERNQVNQVCVCVRLQECVLNHRLEPLGMIEGFTAEVGASGTFCPSHMTFPVDVSFYSVSEDNAPSPYMVRPFVGFPFDRVRGCICEGERASARSDDWTSFPVCVTLFAVCVVFLPGRNHPGVPG